MGSVDRNPQQSVIYVYFFVKCVVRWFENSVRFVKYFMGIGFKMGQCVRYGRYVTGGMPK